MIILALVCFESCETQEKSPRWSEGISIVTGELRLVIAEVTVTERVRWLTPYLHTITFDAILGVLRYQVMEISPKNSVRTFLSQSCVSAMPHPSWSFLRGLSRGRRRLVRCGNIWYLLLRLQRA